MISPCRSVLLIPGALFLTAALLASPLQAAPVISTGSGTIAHGDTVNIYGTDFGIGSTILTWDDFDGGTAGTPLHDNQPIDGHQWNVIWRLWNGDNEHDITYSTDFAYSGQNSARVWWKSYSMLAMGWAGEGPYQELYMTYLRYSNPRTFSGEPYTGCPDNMNHKLFYWYSNSSPQELFRTKAILSDCGSWAMNFSSGLPGYLGNVYFDSENRLRHEDSIFTWQRWEVWQKQESNAPGSDDGELEVTIDCIDRIDDHGMNTTNLPGDQSYWKDLRLGHMHQGYSDLVARTYYDDVYIADSRARVELGDQPVFANCTKRDIQHHVDWEGNHVQLVMHAPSFAPEETAYLFLVDENGVISDGYEVVMDDTYQPPPPDTEDPQIFPSPPMLPLHSPPPHFLTCTGTAYDNLGVVEIRWSNSLGGFGVAQGTGSWLIEDIELYTGSNVITVTALDAAGNEGSEQFTVDWDAPGKTGRPTH